MNLLEIHQAMIQKFPEKQADQLIKDSEAMVVTPTIQHIIDASKFRAKHKKKRLSYADCLGYIIAADMKVKFLTGDKEFRGVPNVEFVQ